MKVLDRLALLLVVCGPALVANDALAQAAGQEQAAGPSQATGQAADVDATSQDDEATAREQFEAGRTAYDGGDYEAALGHFEAAYKQSGRPRLLYNIGLAADRVRQNERALEAFRAYLAAIPDADNRVEVENRVRALEHVMAQRQQQAAATQAPQQPQQARAAAAPTQPSPAENEAAEGGLPLGPIIVAGAGVALLGTSVVFGLSAKSSEDEYAKAPVGTREQIDAARDKLDTAESQATIANVTLGIGIAAIAGAAVWWFLDDGSERPVTATAVPLPHGAAFAIAGSWGMP